MGLQNQLDAIDIQHGRKFPLNVIIMGQGADGHSTAQFITIPDANNPIHPFNSIGQYGCVVLITSDDTRAIYVRFTFD
jgi:hypothetical protein